MNFDEDKAIEFIRNFVGEDVSASYSDDEILYIIDIIWDYYERKGYLTVNSSATNEELLDDDDLINYVRKELKNDQTILMDPKDVDLIVKAELEYEESLEA